MQAASENGYRAKRLGFTLVEVLGTLSVLLVIALASTSMLAKVTGIGLEGKHADQARADIARLSIKLRDDVHAADQTALGDRAQSIDLVTGDRTVRYQFHADSQAMIRTQLESDNQVSIERFRITQRCRPEFDIQDGQVSLRLTAADALDPWIIQAVSR